MRMKISVVVICKLTPTYHYTNHKAAPLKCLSCVWVLTLTWMIPTILLKVQVCVTQMIRNRVRMEILHRDVAKCFVLLALIERNYKDISFNLNYEAEVPTVSELLMNPSDWIRSGEFTFWWMNSDRSISVISSHQMLKQPVRRFDSSSQDVLLITLTIALSYSGVSAWTTPAARSTLS